MAELWLFWWMDMKADTFTLWRESGAFGSPVGRILVRGTWCTALWQFPLCGFGARRKDPSALCKEVKRCHIFCHNCQSFKTNYESYCFMLSLSWNSFYIPEMTSNLVVLRNWLKVIHAPVPSLLHVFNIWKQGSYLRWCFPPPPSGEKAL